jgi:hypothetical protein
VNDITVLGFDQFPNPIGGRQVNFSPHGNGKDVNTGPNCPFFHRGTGLADQMAGDPARIEPHQQIQGLLLPAPPGSFGVDVQDIHISGFWLLDTGCRLLVTGCWSLVAGYWLLVAGHLLQVSGAGCWPKVYCLFKCTEQRETTLRNLSAFGRFCGSLFSCAVCLSPSTRHLSPLTFDL